MPSPHVPYPTRSRERDDWIVSRRPVEMQASREALDVWHPQQILVEEEADGSGCLATVATLFLTNR